MASNVVEVTQQHIDEGFCGNPEMCPVALALGDWNNEAWYIMDYAFDGKEREWKIDPGLTVWISRFDQRQPVAPIALVMDCVLRTIGLSEPVKEGGENE